MLATLGGSIIGGIASSRHKNTTEAKQNRSVDGTIYLLEVSKELYTDLRYYTMIYDYIKL